MTQQAGQGAGKTLPIGRIALIAGAFAAAFAGVYAVSRHRDEAEPVVDAAPADAQSIAGLEQRTKASPDDAAT